MFIILKNKKNTPLPSNYLPSTHKGQVILEFTFCMIVIMIMIYGVIKVFHWTGKDVVERQQAHESALFGGGTPRDQINPQFYGAADMNAIWDGN